MSKQHAEELRRKAEERLATRNNRIENLERADLVSLAHELAVHQMELEIQNDELRRTQLEAQEARDRYLDLYDFAPVAYFTLDEHNRIVEANLTGCRLLSTERRDLLQTRFTKFIRPEDADTFYFCRKDVLAGGVRQTCELKMVKADGAGFDARLESVKSGQGRLRVAVLDVTERKRAEKTLKEANETLEQRGAEPIRILILEDNASDAELMKRELSKAGFAFTAQWVQDREAFRAALDTFAPDLILADYSLPGFDGLTASAWARQRWADIPVVIVSGAIGEEVAIETLKAGATDYVLKQRLSRLGPVVRRALQEAQEVAQRKQTEKELRVSQERLALAASGTRIGMYDRDLVTGAALCTEQFARLLGLRPTTTTTLSQVYHYHDWAERVNPGDLGRIEIELGRCLAERAPYEAEYRVLWADGSVHWIADRGVFQYESDGQCTRMLGVVMDITERKRTEEVLKVKDSAIAASLNAIAIADLQGRLTYVNPAFLRLWGYDDEHEVLGRPVLDFWEESERAMAIVQAIRNGGGWMGELVAVRKDGALRNLYLSSSTVLNDEGTPICMMSSFTDITERKQTEEAMRQLNVTLESKVAERTAQLQHRARQLQKMTLEVSLTEDRERKRMAEILHDDLQQIIAAAKFHLSLLRNRVKSDASLRDLAAQIDEMLKEAIEKSRGLAHELSPAVLHDGDFAETLGWLAKQMRAKHGLVVQVRASGPAPLQSEAIRSFLYRAIQELLFNVAKHARVHEARIRVRRRGPCVCLSISDRGRGFDPQELRETAEYGLLSIRERIELLGGRMKIKSAAGKGSTFYMVVPDGEANGVGSEAETRSDDHALEAGRSAQEDKGRLRVLLADDHRIVREGLRALLSEDYGIEIVGEAAHGREAVDLALRLEPDVVIMDVSMPLIDGDVATRQIKANLPETRVIALSTYNEPEMIQKMYQAGAEGYILKTASSEELLAAIRGSRPRELSRPTR